MPLVVKDVVNVLIPVNIPIWRSRARYSAGQVVIARTNVVAAHVQEGVIISAQTVVNLQKTASEVNIWRLSKHPVK